MKVSAPKPDHDWQAEDDLRTLMRAEEICKDSARLNRAAAMAKKQAEAADKAKGIVARYRSKK